MRFLTKRLEDLTVVHRAPADREKIYFGAWVTLEAEDGSTCEYRIVGPDEFDLSKHLLSMDSPLARAMLGKRIDDEVQVHTPEGIREYYVAAVRY